MERSSKGHLEEAVNLRSFYLRLLGKIWILPLAALLGALLCGGIYTLATVTYGPAKTYSAKASLYISFAYNEKTGTMVDYYNAYTWNNQLKSTDAVLDPIIESLAGDGIRVLDDGGVVLAGENAVITKTELLSSINMDIPSDVRVMLLTVTNNDSSVADAILRACVDSLENYGDTNEAFDSIKMIGMENARLDTYTDRTTVAMIFGALFGAVITILVLLLLDAIDDAVYTPEDCEKRYRIPVLGVLFDGNDNFFKNELMSAYDKLIDGAGEVVVISADSIENSDISEKDTESLKSALGSDRAGGKTKLLPMAVPGSVLDNYRKIGTCDGVILCVPYGKRNGAMAEHVIAQLKKHECPVLGMVLTRASKGFLYRYYGLKGKKI